jgi:hypothetical protein
VANSKPKGRPPSWSWLTELDLDVEKPPRVGRRTPRLVNPMETDWIEDTLARWRDWFAQAETCLGVKLTQHADRRIWSRFAADLALLQTNRQLLVELLIAGGREGAIPGVPTADRPLQLPPGPERAVAAAIGEMVAAGFASKAKADAAAVDTAGEAGSAADDGTAMLGTGSVDATAGAAAPSIGRGVPGNGTAPPDPNEPAFVSEMNREPPADPALLERSATTNPPEG